MNKTNGTANRIVKSIFSENAVLRPALGVCPALAVTLTALGGIAMGILTLLVLLCANLTVFALRKIIPKSVKIPVYLIITALFTTVLQLLSKAFLPSLNDLLGIYFPLITVNCIIIGGAKTDDGKKSALNVMLDAAIIGLSFAATLTVIGIVREIIGCGTVFGLSLTGGYIQPFLLAITAPGGFLTLGFLAALVNKLTDKPEKYSDKTSETDENGDYAENAKNDDLSGINSGEEDITL